MLFKPQAAWRVRWNTNTDTPLPPDEPTAPNPPEGAIINYYLKSAASGPVTLEILDGDGKLVRRYSSDRRGLQAESGDEHRSAVLVPRPLTRSRAAPGMHRFTWDVHYQPLDWRRSRRVGGPTLPIAAIGYNTVPAPTTPWVNPGHVHREADGERQELHAADRREAGSAREDAGAGDAADLHAVEGGVLRRGRRAAGGAAGAALRDQIAKLRPQATGAIGRALAALDRKHRRAGAAPSQAAAAAARRGGGGGDGRAGRRRVHPTRSAARARRSPRS